MNCTRCSSALDENDNYCGKCGRSVRGFALSLSPRVLATVLVVTAVVGGGLLYFEPKLLGTPPTMKHTFSAAQDGEYETATIQSLKAQVAADPENTERRRELTRMLWARLADFDSPPPGLVLDLIDELGAVLMKEPEDLNALSMMANLTFNQKVFDKSAEYFERYLTLKPDDLEARASYASALTFVGEFDKALSQLDEVLVKNPSNFQALAYKAITYAQMGKTADAKILGERALALAPTEEARARFGGFVSSLGSAPEASKSERTVVTFVRTHTVAGPKFVTAQFKDGTLTLGFRNFPMEAMPEGVRIGFLEKLTVEAKKDPEIRVLVLADADSGTAMESITITP